MQKNQKPRAVVLAGGASSEREVSLQGGRAVVAALRTRRLETAWLDPAETPLAEFPWQPGDVAFLVLHGEFGEDGQVQAILESLKIPYTGSGPRASGLAFSKSATKERLGLASIPTPASVVISRGDSPESLHRRAQFLGYPIVVKPDAQGSSLGVSVVFKESELHEAVARCFELDKFGLLESYVPGSEWTVGLWDEKPLPPICIETPQGFYDYSAKYADDETRYQFESTAPPEVLNELEHLAVETGRAVATRGIARVDFRLDDRLQPWVLEINTIPGMTDHSLIPKAADRLGIGFPELCERIVLESSDRTATRRAA